MRVLINSGPLPTAGNSHPSLPPTLEHLRELAKEVGNDAESACSVGTWPRLPPSVADAIASTAQTGSTR